MLFDSHCHLNDKDLYKEIDSIIQNAKNVGVTKFLVVGYDKESSFLAVELAKKYEEIFAAVGFQPEELDGVSEEDFIETMSLLDEPKVVALGEIGLDYYWEKDPQKIERQKEFFVRQIGLANEHQLPISVHCRDAIGDCLNILKDNRPLSGGVMHCYSGSVDSMKEFIKIGMYISLGGPVTFKNAKTPKEVAAEVPLDKLLIETDSPYLAPHPLRGTRNEPANVKLVAEQIANIRNTSLEEIEKATYENACNLFHV